MSDLDPIEYSSVDEESFSLWLWDEGLVRPESASQAIARAILSSAWLDQVKREAAAEALEEAADYFEEEMTRPVEGWVRDYLRRRAAFLRTGPTS